MNPILLIIAGVLLIVAGVRGSLKPAIVPSTEASSSPEPMVGDYRVIKRASDGLYTVESFRSHPRWEEVGRTEGMSEAIARNLLDRITRENEEDQVIVVTTKKP